MVILMNKVILIDGNNLLYRSYYATAYSGSLMHNSKNFPTNALYGLINILDSLMYVNTSFLSQIWLPEVIQLIPKDNNSS